MDPPAPTIARSCPGHRVWPSPPQPALTAPLCPLPSPPHCGAGEGGTAQGGISVSPRRASVSTHPGYWVRVVRSIWLFLLPDNHGGASPLLLPEEAPDPEGAGRLASRVRRMLRQHIPFQACTAGPGNNESNTRQKQRDGG